MSTRSPRFGRRPHGSTRRSILNNRFRSFLALSLAALSFLAPLSAPSSALAASVTGAKDDSKAPSGNQVGKIHGFMIEMVDGKTVCRDATAAELPYIMAPEDTPREKVIVRAKDANSNNSYARSEGTDNVGSGGLTIIFNVLPQLNIDQDKAKVVAAFEKAAQYWTNTIKSPVTVEIDIDYGNNSPGGGAFGPGVLGSTGSASVKVDYPGARQNLIAAAGPGDGTLYNNLPANTLPTDTGNGAIVDVPASVAKALGVSAGSGVVASIAFNKKFPFDFDPSDGISGNTTDFVAVATHEIGHALGFVSGSGEGPTATPTTWDLFRFRPGTTGATFTGAQRIMSRGGQQVFFTGQTYTVQNVGTTDLALSTGGPDGTTVDGGDGNQSSHWKDDDQASGKYIGIMDPTIPKNLKFEPTGNDYAALEAMGWDLVGGAPIPNPPPAPAPPGNDNFAAAQTLNGCSGTATGTNLGATKEAGEPNNPASTGSTRSVWYQWTAPSTGEVTVDTKGSGFDTTLAVYSYSGNGFGGLTLIQSNDDQPEDTTTPEHEVSSVVTFNATQGTVYRISVNGFNNGGDGGDIGNIKLNWSQTGCTATTPNIISLSQTTYNVNEAATNTALGFASLSVDVTRTDVSGTATVQYFTSDQSGGNECNLVTGKASQRCDYGLVNGTLKFAPGDATKTINIPIINDGYVEGNETFTVTLQNAVGATIGTNQTTVTIVDSGVATTPAQNPYVGVNFFVRMNYLDFLGREPDGEGFGTWTGVLNGCGPDKGFLGAPKNCDRAFVSHGFIASPEFTDRGYNIYRMYEVALSRLPRYAEFVPDMAAMSGVPGSAELEQNTTQFAESFAARGEFTGKYADVSTPAQAALYIARLEQNAGVTLPATATTLPGQPPQYSRQDLINKRLSGEFSLGKTLRAFVEQKVVYDKFFERGFVTMQYFGFLRRDPDLNDLALAGWTEWVFVFTNGGAARNRPDILPRDIHHLTFGFIYSEEYRKRFGQP